MGLPQVNCVLGSTETRLENEKYNIDFWEIASEMHYAQVSK